MLEKIISFITAIVVSVTSFFQGVPQTPPPAQNPPAPRFNRPREVDPQKETPTSTPTTKPIQADVPKPAPLPPTPPPAPVPSPKPDQPKTIAPRPINLRSVVGILCEFQNNEEKIRYRGSGVIVREGTYEKGTYILTNRHVVDVAFAKKFEGEDVAEKNITLSGCNIHILNADGKILPEEKYPYPYYDLKVVSGIQHDFKARLAYLPKTENLTENEELGLDYALLEITGKNEGKYLSNENPRLVAAPILVPEPTDWMDTIAGKRIVMPGYAFQQIGSGAFDEFRLLTKDGVVREIYAGDEELKNTPFSILVETPPDAYGGRSGSPIFYNGYLIGLVATKALPAPNSKNFSAFQPAITGILKNLETQTDIRNIFQDIHRME